MSGNLRDTYAEGFENGAAFVIEEIMIEVLDNPMNNSDLLKTMKRIYNEMPVNIRSNQ